MAGRVTLFSAASSPHSGRLEFSEPIGARGGEFKCFGTLELDGEEWSVGLEMIHPYRSDMLGFFEELGVEASGWTGVKSWESEFAEMRVDARNPGDGEAILEVLIRWPPDYGAGQSGTIHVRAAELPRFAKQLRGFLRCPTAARASPA